MPAESHSIGQVIGPWHTFRKREDISQDILLLGFFSPRQTQWVQKEVKNQFEVDKELINIFWTFDTIYQSSLDIYILKNKLKCMPKNI